MNVKDMIKRSQSSKLLWSSKVKKKES